MDERLRRYAEVLADHCLRVQPGDQVLGLIADAESLSLTMELHRAIIARGGNLLPCMMGEDWSAVAAQETPLGSLDEVPKLEALLFKHCDALIVIRAPNGTAIPFLNLERERLTKWRLRMQNRKQLFDSRFSPFQWRAASCLVPTPFLASQAGISMSEYEDFFYQACLRDWRTEEALLQRVKARFDGAHEVRILSTGTDIRLSLRERLGAMEDGRKQMPGSEVFYAPVEDATEGHITFEWPSTYHGGTVRGVRLKFQGGKVVDASAEEGEEHLLRLLDTDAGSRIVGELGLGCNYDLTRNMNHTAFDEKIGGTVHLALGFPIPICGGKNQSAIHWDLVKDLRQDGAIWVDGELVQRNGRFVGL
jgi:aminopeptidase